MDALESTSRLRIRSGRAVSRIAGGMTHSPSTSRVRLRGIASKSIPDIPELRIENAPAETSTGAPGPCCNLTVGGRDAQPLSDVPKAGREHSGEVLEPLLGRRCEKLTEMALDGLVRIADEEAA